MKLVLNIEPKPQSRPKATRRGRHAGVYHQLETQRPKIIIHAVDSAGGELVGKITDKEIIEGRYTLTVGAYGKFLVTKEQYEAIKVGDPIPEYLKGRKQ